MSVTKTLPGPTQTTGGLIPANTGTAPPNSIHATQTPGPGTNSPTGSANDKTSHKSAVAVGTTFGVLGLVVAGFVAAYLVKKRDGRVNRFRVIAGEDSIDPDGNQSVSNLGRGAHISGVMQEKRAGWLPRSSLPALGRLGILTGGRNARSAQERRDMLADEDTRQFGLGSLYGTGDGSSWSLKSVGALVRGIRSRDASVSSTPRTGTPRREKSDPFSDGLLIKDEEIGLVGGGAGATAGIMYADVGRPPHVRETSYSSVLSVQSYNDPFTDSILKEPRYQPGGGEGEVPSESTRLANPQPAHPPPIHTMFPLSTNVHTLSPLAEGTSINTLTDPSVSSHEQPLSPFDSSSRGASSYTSLDTPKAAALPQAFRSSIIDANPPPTQPMSRSNSWWARFSRTSFLERRASDSRPHSRMLDIRDPNPAPRLLAIEESTHSASPDSPSRGPGSGSQKSRRNSRLYNGAHGKSVSSLQTTKTADSEAIERLGGTMVVVQRDTSGNRRLSSGNISSSSTGGRATPETAVGQGAFITDEQGALAVASPKDMTPAESFPGLGWPSAPSPKSSVAEGAAAEHRHGPGSGKRAPSSGAVAARIQAYEQRMSLDSPPLTPETRNTKQREERTKKIVTINYGLAPRQNLYVANPDHGATSSADS